MVSTRIQVFVPRTLSVLFVAAVLPVGCGGPPSAPTPPPAPTPLAVSSVAPSTATIGAIVTIYGSGFRAGATVTFGGVKVEAPNVSISSIVARSPDVAPGRVDIVVTNTNGESATLVGGFTVARQLLSQSQTTFPGGALPKITFTGGPFGILNGLLPPHDPGPVDITVTHPKGENSDDSERVDVCTPARPDSFPCDGHGRRLGDRELGR
jgi:IPT/TIG domain